MPEINGPTGQADTPPDSIAAVFERRHPNTRVPATANVPAGPVVTP